MTQATPYTRSTGFADDERNNAGGRATVRTAQVDAELDAIGQSLNLTIANLALLQRDDGVMRDGAVPVTALGTDTLKLLSTGTAVVRGAWVTATAYAVKDLVTQSGNTYICAVAHTSGTFATDLAAVKWVLFQIGANPSAAAIPFSSTLNIASTNLQAALVEVDTNARSREAAASAALADTTDAAKNSGSIGFSYALSYVSGTLGRWLKDLATSAGATFLGFMQSGTGASLNTIQKELRRVVWAEQFGAIGDGASHPLSGITSYNGTSTVGWTLAQWQVVFPAATALTNEVDGCAIMAALASNTTGTVCLGRGTFLTSFPIDKPVGTAIWGQGRGVTRIKMAASANAAAVIRTSGFAGLTGTTNLGGEFNSEIRDLTVDGNKANNTAGLGFQLYGKYFRIENVGVESCFGMGIYTEYAGGDDFSTPTKTLEASILNVFVQQCGGTGIQLKGPHDMTLKHITAFSNGGWGLDIQTSVHATDVNTYLNTSGGYVVQTTTAGAITYSGSIYGTAVVGSTATGIGAYLKSGGNTLSASLSGGPIALQIDSNNNVYQGQVANSTSKAIFLSGASAQVIADVAMFSNSGTIFSVSTATLKSQVRAFIGDALGTLQDSAFPGSWDINGYTGFTGNAHQLYGTSTFYGGRVCLPDTNFAIQSTRGLFCDAGPPLAGTFNRGDRITNNTPTVGSPKGWICTVSGSPGTWVSEGNL